MYFRSKHFPAHHNDRTSLTSAVISEFKVHEMRQRPGLRAAPRWGSLQRSPRPRREGKGIRREGNWERKKGKRREGRGKGREGGREGERGQGREGPDQVSREIDARGGTGNVHSQLV